MLLKEPEKQIAKINDGRNECPSNASYIFRRMKGHWRKRWIFTLCDSFQVAEGR